MLIKPAIERSDMIYWALCKDAPCNAWDATCASLFVRMMRLKQEKSV